MMNPGSVWGQCPFRRVGWAQTDKLVSGWGYICGKTGSYCEPKYCLGPDEDSEDKTKGESHEEMDQ